MMRRLEMRMMLILRLRRYCGLLILGLWRNLGSTKELVIEKLCTLTIIIKIASGAVIFMSVIVMDTIVAVHCYPSS